MAKRAGAAYRAGPVEGLDQEQDAHWAARAGRAVGQVERVGGDLCAGLLSHLQLTSRVEAAGCDAKADADFGPYPNEHPQRPERAPLHHPQKKTVLIAAKIR